MTFTQFTLKNLLRRPIRTSLTVVGVGVGIGAVVALLGLAWGLERSWAEGLRARKTDLVVRKASGGIVAQTFEETVAAKVRAAPEVAATAGILGEVVSVEEIPMMVLSGREWGSFLWESLKVVDGRLPRGPDEKAVVLGSIAAEALNKKAGDKVTIEVEEFDVAAIVDGGAIVENGAVIMSLPRLQELMRKPGLVSFINIRLRPGTAASAELAKRIQERTPGMRVEVADEVFSKLEGIQTFEAMNWGTSVVALLVGAFGVMNTMFMSVFERTREIGILIALGWKRWRILRMILFESLALCLVAGVIGIGFGVVLLEVLAASPWMNGRLEPHLGWDLAGLALGLAFVVGAVSGLLPALRCTRINPSMAIRES